MNLRDARRSVKRISKLVVSHGSKGGRAQHIPRIIDADPMLVSVLFHDDVVALGDHVIPVDWDYARWYRHAHRVWRKWAPKLGLSTRIHDLRAAFACAKYESLTGLPAPCVGHLVFQENGERQAFSVSDEKARRVIAELLGHDRISITDSYLGCE